MFIDLLENTLFYAENDGGGAGNTTDPNKDEDKGKENEETITLTKAEYETKLNQKYAEGARKAQEGKLATNPDDKGNPASQTNPVVDTNKGLIEDVAKIKDELATAKAMNFATDNNIKSEFKEDLVAIIKGKGLEPTAENVKKEADKHPEWKYLADGSGGTVRPLGSSGGANTPPAVSEKEQAAKLFGL